MSVENESFLTIKQAAQYLGCSTRTLRERVKGNLLPAYRTASNRLFFRKAELDQLLVRVPVENKNLNQGGIENEKIIS